MIEKEPIFWLAQWGGRLNVEVRRQGALVPYTWGLNRGECVLAFLELVLPYLRVEPKREKARQAIADLTRSRSQGIEKPLFD